MLPTLVLGQNAPANACEAGLLATYYRGYFYDDISFFTRAKPGIVNRHISELNFSFNQTDIFNVGDVAVYNSPGNPDEFSATYTGKFYALTGGTYTFYLGSDDAASVWFDQDTQPTVINAGDAHGYREATATKKLSAGFHTLRVYYGEHGGSQGLVLRYDGPGLVQQIVPNGVLYTNKNGNPSPVLTEFELNSVGQQVQLNWTTATEHHSESFVVERSTDGVAFEEIGSLAGAGTSTQAHTYDLIDQHAPLGTTYYRLRQLCGTQAVYSPIKAVEVKEVPLQVSMYPVPNNGTFYLRVQPALPQTATLELWDASGLRAYSAPVLISGQPDIQVSPNVPIGLYTLRLQMANKTIVRRIVIGY
ncbi:MULTISPECIES: PA14 domain-containing protein [Hymenobacter]|uniref:PA14 domain-containing protein n=1 Tax=Hymenobacter TaxID=89966 RepID=UPI0016284A42|nr:PA14 domain-containing protein [Hymenobacter sp. NBH84]